MIPRPEHPYPHFQRKQWLNLNGTWTYELDPGKSGRERGLSDAQGFQRKITVPFPPEAKLSGVNHKDFIEAMFYHRILTIPHEWKDAGHIFLNFGAVDYQADIFLDGHRVGRHRGGSTPFAVDLAGKITPGQNHHLVVAVTDDLRSYTQGAGKQSNCFNSYGCLYTRVTGIWQTVFLEATGDLALMNCQVIPDLDTGRLVFTPTFSQELNGATLTITVTNETGKPEAATVTVPAVSGIPISIPLNQPHPWSPQDPFLYHLDYQVRLPDGTLSDQVASYAGLRKIHVQGNRIFLNNKPIFLRFVLDQGFYPDGIWTAPSAQDLERDIRLSMACGFNGARLHQKVFEPLYHYYADKLGYLTWAEYPSWGMACSRDADTPNADFHLAVQNNLAEWQQCVIRDRNHPSIIAWTPQNETRPQESKIQRYRDYMTQLYDLTKALDPTRPVNDSSGWVHVKTDLWTTHNYTPDADTLLKSLTAEGNGNVARNKPKLDVDYQGQPFLVDEWGGFRYIPAERRDSMQPGWGYHGLFLETPQDLLDRIQQQIHVFLNHPNCSGYCYTQLTDIEQEQNGVLNDDRTPKAPPKQFAELFGRQPEEYQKQDE